MASWIVHLRIAEDLLNRIPNLDPEQFGIGNIAPDSGVADEQFLNYDPPPKVTHYKPDGDAEEGLVSEDLSFYRDYLAAINSSVEPQKFSFLLGYFFHLITDNLWAFHIYRPAKEKWLADFEDKPAFIQAMRADWYGLDFIYVRDHPDSFYWKVFLDSQYTEEYLTHFPEGAIQARIDYIKEMYQKTDEGVQEMYKRPYDYLSKEEMDQFIEDAVAALEKIYRVIWEEKVDLTGFDSGLGLL